MVTNNKRGWIRILEATIAVLIVMGVLLVIYTNESSSPDLEEAKFNFFAVSFSEYHSKPSCSQESLISGFMDWAKKKITILKIFCPSR